MPRDIVRDPETGKPAIIKINYEVQEVKLFEQAVIDTESAYKQAIQTLINAPANSDTLQVAARQRDEAWAALDDAKSELTAAQEIATDSGPGSEVDAGTATASSEVATEELAQVA